MIYRVAQLKQEIGRTKTGIYQDVIDGLLTPPVKLGLRSTGWPRHEIEAIMRARFAGKNNAELQALVKQLVAARSEGFNQAVGASSDAPNVTPTPPTLTATERLQSARARLGV